MATAIYTGSAAPGVQATGRPGQGHLQFAANQGAWWAFYLYGTNQLAAKYSTDGTTWNAPTGSPYTMTGGGGTHSSKGLNYSFYYGNIALTDVCHAILCPSNLNYYHQRFTLGTTWASTNTETLDSQAAGSVPSGSVGCLDSSSYPCDFATGGGNAFSEIYPNADPGGATWTLGTTVNVEIKSASVNITSQAVFPLAARNLLWVSDNGATGNTFTNLLWSLYTFGTGWGAPANVFGSPVTSTDDNAWGACYRTASDIHVFALADNTSTYLHSIYNGTSWAASTAPGTLTYTANSGIAAVSDGTNEYIFVVSGTNIEYNKWNGSAWGGWTVLESGRSNTPAYLSACYSSAKQAIQIIWTETNGANYEIWTSQLALGSATTVSVGAVAGTGYIGGDGASLIASSATVLATGYTAAMAESLAAGSSAVLATGFAASSTAGPAPAVSSVWATGSTATTSEMEIVVITATAAIEFAGAVSAGSSIAIGAGAVFATGFAGATGVALTAGAGAVLATDFPGTISTGIIYWANNSGTSGSGTFSSPWGIPDLYTASGSAYSQGVALSTLQPGDTLYFRGGNYSVTSGASGGSQGNDQLLSPTHSGTSSQPITLSAYPPDVHGGTPVNFTMTSGTQALFGTHTPAVNYVRFLGFTVQPMPIFEGGTARVPVFNMLGTGHEIGWCQLIGASAAGLTDLSCGIFTQTTTGLWVHGCDISLFTSPSNNVNNAGIIIYGSVSGVYEDNYIHGCLVGVYDKDGGLAQGFPTNDIFRRNWLTGNSEVQFRGSTQNGPATFHLYDNVFDGTVNLGEIGVNCEVYNNLFRSIQTSDSGYIAWLQVYEGGTPSGSLGETIWNNVVITGSTGTFFGYYDPYDAYVQSGASAPIAYMDYNVYDGTPYYKFGNYYPGGGGTSFIYSAFRAQGFETDSTDLQSMNAVFVDQTSYVLQSPWNTAGRYGDEVGPRPANVTVASVLDTSRYGPAAMPAGAGIAIGCGAVSTSNFTGGAGIDLILAAGTTAATGFAGGTHETILSGAAGVEVTGYTPAAGLMETIGTTAVVATGFPSGVSIGGIMDPTTATLSAASTIGLVGVASAAFTITLDSAAAVSESFPITYAGGSITTSPVVIGIGQTTGTFTVTPSSSGANNVSLGAGTTGLSIDGSPIAYQAWAHYAAMTDANGTSLANYVCGLVLNSNVFPFSQAQANGADLRVYDATAGAIVPSWLFNFGQPSSYGQPVMSNVFTMYYLATLTSRSHQLWWGNPSASAVSSFSSVFTHGTGFDSGWGDLTTHVVGSGSAARLATAAGLTDPRSRQVYRRSQAPVIPYNQNSGGTQTRDLRILTDAYGKIVPDVGGNWVGYYGQATGGASILPRTVYRCLSADQGITWTNHAQVLGLGASGSYWDQGTMPGTVIQFGAADYRMWFTCNSSVTASGGIGRAVSADGITWTPDAGTVIPNNTSAITSFTCGSVAVPCVRKMSDGNYVMLCEARGAYPWSISGWTSPDAAVWTVMNAGVTLVGSAGGSSWAPIGAANPQILEIASGTEYLLHCNGETNSDAVTDFDFQAGFYTASSYLGPFTPDTNPVAGRLAPSFGVEAGGLFIAPSGGWATFLQPYSSTDNSVASIYQAFPAVGQCGLMVTPATTDASLAGVMITGGGTFTAEHICGCTTHRSSLNASFMLLGLVDSATVPAPDVAGTFGPIVRVAIRRTTLEGDSSSANDFPGAFSVIYNDSGGTTHYFNGAAWGTAITASAGSSDLSREVVASIRYDGANYILGCSYADDGASIFTASIAASSVKAFSAGVALVTGDIFTNAWAGGLYSRLIDVRPYAATEPSMSVPALPVVTHASSLMLGI